MSTGRDAKFSLKVVINKQKTKVLFAEADSNVADVLLSFLTLPLGKIVRILEMHYGINEAPVIGSLTTLYRGLLNLDSSHFCEKGAKQMLVNPTSSFEAECRRLNLGITEKHARYFCCQDWKCGKPHASNISMYSDIATCDCGRPLNRTVVSGVRESPAADAGVFIIKKSSFIICDDLRVVPVVSGFLQTLNNLGITDTHGAELTTLSFGIDDIMGLLMLSLISATPLTDLIIKKTQKCTDLIIKKTQDYSTAVKPGPGILLHHIQEVFWQNSRKMNLKVFLRKSTNVFLLAEATDEFVEFLFSFLAVPLGGVEYMFGGKTCLKNIDNLYRSVTDVIDDKYFTTPGGKNRLINPKLPHGYISKNQFLPLSEESPPKLKLNDETFVESFKSSKGQRNFMKEQTMYIVSDDLTVTPFSISSSVSITNGMGITLSDVKEMDLKIGREEALCILKASLTSTTVLTDALINPMLNKLPKQDENKLPKQDEVKLQKLPKQDENKLPKQDEVKLQKLPKQDENKLPKQDEVKLQKLPKQVDEAHSMGRADDLFVSDLFCSCSCLIRFCIEFFKR